jgi:hypothetical protein
MLLQIANIKIMYEYKYILEPYKGNKTRHDCPICEKNKVFTRYIDSETNEYLNAIVGRCNRESNCGYHYTPKQYFLDNNIHLPTSNNYNKEKAKTPLKKDTSLIDFNIFSSSLKNYESNEFVKFLINIFGIDITNELISKYYIGTSKFWNGATVFWQIDKNYQIRTGKIMLYNPDTGRRVKEPINHINWVHKALKMPDFELSQCFFGEHLLTDKNKPVAIVESEKTAIIASVYLPQFTWLAAGSLTNLYKEKGKVLSGSNVFLFPDLNCFEKWSMKAKELYDISNFVVSDLLEKHATEEERKLGYDLADYLIQYDYNGFTTVDSPKSLPIIEPKSIMPRNQEGQPIMEQIEDWDYKIDELEQYFNSINLENQSIKLNQSETILNAQNFITSHLTTLKRNNGKKSFLPYFDRLQSLKNHLQNIA